jgi:hypothetical protein
VNKPLVRIALAAFIFGAVSTLVDAPAATATARRLPESGRFYRTQQMPTDKPNKPNEPRGEPRGDGCTPIGVTKTSTGAVYAIEECHGQRYQRRMDK